MARAANLGMGALPARTFHAFLNRRNVFDEWGLEVRGGWATGDSFIGDSYLPYAYCNTGSAEVSRVKPGSAAAVGVQCTASEQIHLSTFRESRQLTKSKPWILQERDLQYT